MRGFSLIEMLIYIGLFALIMTAALEASFAVSESSARDATRAELQEEGEFLIGKIDWIIGQSREVAAPAAGVSSQNLSVTNDDGSAVSVSLSAGDGLVSVARGPQDPVQLNDDGIRITQVSFEHIAGVPDGLPEHIDTSLTLIATSSTGKPMTQTFQETFYVLHE